VHAAGSEGQICYVLEQNAQGRKVFSCYQHNRHPDVGHNLLEHFRPFPDCACFRFAANEFALVQTDPEGFYCSSYEKFTKAWRKLDSWEDANKSRASHSFSTIPKL
jgi:hypothetical protein